VYGFFLNPRLSVAAKNLFFDATLFSLRSLRIERARRASPSCWPVAYTLIRRTFTSRATPDRPWLKIVVEYLSAALVDMKLHLAAIEQRQAIAEAARTAAKPKERKAR
jgi:hypothetical protein